jgi:hypothetical protein
MYLNFSIAYFLSLVAYNELMSLAENEGLLFYSLMYFFFLAIVPASETEYGTFCKILSLDAAGGI